MADSIDTCSVVSDDFVAIGVDCSISEVSDIHSPDSNDFGIIGPFDYMDECSHVFDDFFGEEFGENINLNEGEYNDPFHEHINRSKFEVMLMIYAFFIRFNLSWIALEALVQLFNSSGFHPFFS